MDVVEQKFNNFVIFIKENIKNSTYTTLLGNISLNTFLLGLKQHEGKIAKEVSNIVFEKFGINKDEYPTEVIDKFNRYIDYFLQIVKKMQN